MSKAACDVPPRRHAGSGAWIGARIGDSNTGLGTTHITEERKHRQSYVLRIGYCSNKLPWPHGAVSAGGTLITRLHRHSRGRRVAAANVNLEGPFFFFLPRAIKRIVDLVVADSRATRHVCTFLFLWLVLDSLLRLLLLGQRRW